MAGCAGAVIGERWDIEACRCCFAAGKRMGETKDGQRRREMSARPSTMSKVAGQVLSLGYVDGRCWMYSGLRFRMNLPIPSGKHSRSKTKACRSCPQARGISIQLPTQSGFPLFPQIPFSSAALYANSSDRLKAYIATLIRSCDAGHTPRKSPDSAAPTAGVYREVKPRLIRGLRRRKGRAEGSSNEARRRRKKRCRRRWNSRIRDNEADMRRWDAFELAFFAF